MIWHWYLRWKRSVFLLPKRRRRILSKRGSLITAIISGSSLKGKLISFADGMVTNLTDLTDEMYEKADMHDEHGAWQMIFGLNTIPACRKKGYAGIVLRRAIHDAEKEGRRGLVLTCKKELIHYYGKFGFLNEGISVSVHGNVVWYQMRLTF